MQYFHAVEPNEARTINPMLDLWPPDPHWQLGQVECSVAARSWGTTVGSPLLLLFDQCFKKSLDFKGVRLVRSNQKNEGRKIIAGQNHWQVAGGSQ